MKVLVTGGAGYIGSITSVELQAAGHEVVILDSLFNAKIAVLDRIAQVSGRRPGFVQADVRDTARLVRLLQDEGIEAVLHFAALKAVGESVVRPLAYYAANVAGSLSLLAAMHQVGVRTLVFSSSATVYGVRADMPLREDAPTGACNPYGHSKWMVEQVLRDQAVAELGSSFTLLRYFNPVGAHPSGLLGEDPQGVPNNLMPYLAQVAVGRRPQLTIYGQDWPTPDGTGVRDYLHVCDLARGHVDALVHGHGRAGLHVFNLGTGHGRSVLEVLRAFEHACGQAVPHVYAGRRAGDVAACWADPTRAAEVLGWRAERDLQAMCADTWRWQSMNPEGYPA
ncbi:MAG: hypothetical protein RL722_591 [Pseudomonadota bacterium]|jgi:UDP-glucose 4-epimerase